MIIVGINSQYDSTLKNVAGGATALMVDGQVRMAVAEDRITRTQYQGGYQASLQQVLAENGLCVRDVDRFYISFYGNPLLPTHEMVRRHIDDLGLGQTPEKLAVVPSHHLSHAYLSYFLSPFDQAVIVVADNEGSLIFPKNAAKKGTVANFCERNSYYWADGNGIALIGRDFERPGQVGFGKAYNKFNRYIGFGGYHQAGKTMGLSSYGRPCKDYEGIDLWTMDEYGSLASVMIDTYDTVRDVTAFFALHGVQAPRIEGDQPYLSQEYKDLAYFIQHQLNKWMAAKIRVLIERTDIQNVCLSGGVALNGVTNSYVETSLSVPVFAPPFPSDQGQALGNAIYGYLQSTGLNHNSAIPRARFPAFTYLGASHTPEEVRQALAVLANVPGITVLFPKDFCGEVASMLVEGKILGWFQGRSEYGARALGNRSILAAPDRAELRDRVNRLKRRELFRPLAPAVLAGHVEEYFTTATSNLWPYMLGVASVRTAQRNRIPGVVHVDGTARLQVVERAINARFYELIEAYWRLSGLPMVINTSFNLAGEPIVETPTDAIRSFLAIGLDGLAVGDALVVRTAGGADLS